MRQPGDRFGPFEIVALIDRGGMGEVYRAHDARLRRDVALKILPAELASQPAVFTRFQRESRAASALNHPNIVVVFDIGDEPVPYIAMELVGGPTLKSLLEEGPLPVAKALKIAGQIADGLAAAHDKGIVHRDIKPDNIALTAEGTVKVLDFGLAKPQPTPDGPTPLPGEPDYGRPDAAVTREGVLVGTVAYMSPEQASGREVDHRSDQFNLGLILHEMLTGVRPFLRGSVPGTLAAIIREPAPSLPPLDPRIDASLARILARCLGKDPADRYASTRDLARDLEALRDEVARPRRPAGTFPVRWLRERRTWVFGVAVAGVLVATAVMHGCQRPRSIAVLPFRNLSQDTDQRFFALGMTDVLITDLSQIEGLTVISLQSVLPYENTTKTPSQIASELGVQALIEGSVLRAGGRIRITTRMINAAGELVWPGTFDHPLEDVLELQKQVARAIVQELRPKLTDEERTRLTKRRDVPLPAFEAYLRGRFLWNSRRPDAIVRSVEHFKEAIKIFPEYAEAHAGLADAYNTLGGAGYSLVRPSESRPLAKAAALEALRLDRDIAEAHATLASVLFEYDWDWQAAEMVFRRAIELRPGYAHPHQWYAMLLNTRGRHEEARKELAKAIELDPASPVIGADRVLHAYHARRYDEALDRMREAIERNPDFHFTHLWSALALLAVNRADDAIVAARKGYETSGGSTVSMAILARAHAAAGHHLEADRLLRELQEQAQKSYVPRSLLAWVCSALGRTDEAFAHFEQALADRDAYMILLDVEPTLDALRPDPRFAALVARVRPPPPGDPLVTSPSSAASPPAR